MSTNAKQRSPERGNPRKRNIKPVFKAVPKAIVDCFPAKPYRTVPRTLGLRRGFGYDNIAELLVRAEGETSR